MADVRLIYASIAQPGLTYEKLTEILATADERNQRDAISGILCYGGSTFLQALEGERSVVNLLYNRITRDSRNATCEILSYGLVEARAFREWSMKLVSWDNAYTPRRRALALRHAGMRALEPQRMTGEQALGFLIELAELERHRDDRRRA